jgi:hypothetical protein
MGETNTFSVVHETSPLMPGQQEVEGENLLPSGNSMARDESKSSWYLFLLTVSIGG